MADNRYPDVAELQRIRDWPDDDFPGLMEFIGRLWWWPECGEQESGPDWSFAMAAEHNGKAVYRLRTGGWSGNEDLIAALQDNAMFWITCWEESRRGGHYTFEIQKHLTKPAPQEA